MKKVCLISLLALTACANVGNFQQECYALHSKFDDAFSCIKQKMSEDRRYKLKSNAGLVSEYQITGDVLSEQVRQGKMSNVQAKLALAEKKSQLESAEREQALVNAIATKKTPSHTNYFVTGKCTGPVIMGECHGTIIP